MYCEKISLKNYRNIENAEISLSPEINVLYGENAQGKTNILEAAYYFAYGKSFRQAKDKELIRFGKDSASIKIEFTDKDRKRTHEVRFFDSSRKVCLKENIKTGKMSEFIGVFRAVLFSPEHLSVVKDGPSERRNFEDIAISQLYPAYMSSLSRYQKTLLQRNSLLKDPESYLQKVGFFKGLMAKANKKLGFDYVCITTQRFQKQAPAFFKALSEKIQIGVK